MEVKESDQLPAIPVGSEFNLLLQTVAVVLLISGLRYALKAYRIKKVNPESETKEEEAHGSLVKVAVILAIAGAAIWMVPNLLLGW